MSDLLAKCDWHGDELHVELPQWPEVVTVWVNGKAMPYAPVTDDHKRIYDRCINRVGQLEAENEKLRNQLEDEKAENGWAREFLDRIGPKCGTKDCPDLVAYVGRLEDENARLRSCLSDDAENARLIKGENVKLRELVRDLYECVSHANEQDWFYFERHMLGCGMSCTVNGEGCGLSVFADRLRELGIEVEP